MFHLSVFIWILEKLPYPSLIYKCCFQIFLNTETGFSHKQLSSSKREQIFFSVFQLLLPGFTTASHPNPGILFCHSNPLHPLPVCAPSFLPARHFHRQHIFAQYYPPSLFCTCQSPVGACHSNKSKPAKLRHNMHCLTQRWHILLIPAPYFLILSFCQSSSGWSFFASQPELCVWSGPIRDVYSLIYRVMSRHQNHVKLST